MDLQREPALLVGVLAAVLNVLVGFGVGELSNEQATLIVAFVNAVAGAVIAWRTRPVAPGVFLLVVSAGAALAAGFGLEFSQEQVAAVGALVVSVLAIINREQVSPVPAKV